MDLLQLVLLFQQHFSPLDVLGLAICAILIEWLWRKHKKRVQDQDQFEHAVDGFFENYVFYTNKCNPTEPHAEPSATCRILGVTKSDYMQSFNRNNKDCWLKYHYLLSIREYEQYRKDFDNLCHNHNITNKTQFVEWLQQQDRKATRLRKKQAIRHNKSVSYWSGYKIGPLDIDYHEILS